MSSPRPDLDGVHPARFDSLLAAGWTTAYPTQRGVWTVAGPQGWGALEPETFQIDRADPRRDPALPALDEASKRGALTNYRVGRRAVIATGSTFLKVVRPKRMAGLVERHCLMESVATELCGSHIRELNFAGTIEVWPAEGLSLYLMLQQSTAAVTTRAVRSVARGLVQLHGAPLQVQAAPIEPAPPERWLEVLARAEGHPPREFVAVSSLLPPMLQRGNRCLAHGDLHDKNIFVAGDTAQLIDLDGLGQGFGEDDVANLAVHLELRALQGRLPMERALELKELLIDSYAAQATLDDDRLLASMAHTWFRLACIYRYRSGPANLSAQLLARALAISESARTPARFAPVNSNGNFTQLSATDSRIAKCPPLKKPSSPY